MTNAPATCPGDGNLLDDEGICGFCGNVPAAFDDEETCPVHRQPVNLCQHSCDHGNRKASSARRATPPGQSAYLPDWNRPHPRVVADQRHDQRLDHNGMDITAILARFSEDELAAARHLARLHGNRHDLIGTDPANTGWRFLRDACVALGGKDPGRSPYERLALQKRQARQPQKGRAL